MHLLIENSSGPHTLAPLISWVVVIGGFLGCLTFLWALNVAAKHNRLLERVRLLELELARLHPRADVGDRR